MFSSLIQKATSYITEAPTPSPFSSGKPSKAVLFRSHFRLPDSQSPLQEILCELSLPGSDHYSGKLYLSESFLCFSPSPPSASASAPATASVGFTLPLCAIRRVERLHSRSYMFALAITTWHGIGSSGASGKEERMTLQFVGMRSSCEAFCDRLKRGLRNQMGEVKNLRILVESCYSEYLLGGPPDKKKSLEGKDGPRQEREPPNAGLGMTFRYPGDSKKLRDRSKMRLWAEYLRENGRNVTLIRQPTFHKLIRVGLPNRLRGEMWEVTSGSIYLRLFNPTLYTDTIQEFEGRHSLSIDEIEKDLNRSLPEYRGFQSEEGIGRLRRVLGAYSWRNLEVGYCQAMNIVVAALLIYTTEPQAFFLLSTLCDRLVPGYYSTTMYGTLLDQRVFESLVEKTMPILWEHLVKADVQLSVVSLPWFLSLYINSMPLVFAFRVLDVFFLEGPKVLFQIGLAILRINGEDLLDATDDGAFISILKSYFSRLDESAHPRSENEKLRAVTRFQELMVVAFKEFSNITQNTVSEQRAKHRDAVMSSIESFAKRTQLRNLGPESKRLKPDELSAVYDRYYTVIYERQARLQRIADEADKLARKRNPAAANYNPKSTSNDAGRPGLGQSSLTGMNLDAFREFLSEIAPWAVSDSQSPSPSPAYASRLSPWGRKGEPADHDFIRRLFSRWDTDLKSSLSLANVVGGLADIVGRRKDIMSTITYWFELYDDDGDGKVDREGILRISEALLFVTRRGVEGDEELLLSAVSGFIRRCFEYADPDRPSSANNDRPAEREVETEKQSEDHEDLVDLLESEDEEEDDPLTAAMKEAERAEREREASEFEPPTPTSPSPPPPRPTSKTAAVTANPALDPNKPLSITLPTFRMVILADETLESFFESGFQSSFHILPSSTSPLPSSSSSPFPAGGASQAWGGAVNNFSAGAKGIRGVLDGLVDEATRVAAEVRRRMEESQAAAGQDEEEDEDDAGAGDVGLKDLELLRGAEAEAGVEREMGVIVGGESAGGHVPGQSLSVPKGGGQVMEGRQRSVSTGSPGAGPGVVEFEG